METSHSMWLVAVCLLMWLHVAIAAVVSHPGAAAGSGTGGVSIANSRMNPARSQFVQLVQGMDWVPVLIDFGLTKQISTSIRLALAKMVVSAELLDYGGLLDSHLVWHSSQQVVW